MESDRVEEVIFREGFSGIIFGCDASVCEKSPAGGRLTVTDPAYMKADAITLKHFWGKNFESVRGILGWSGKMSMRKTVQ